MKYLSLIFLILLVAVTTLAQTSTPPPAPVASPNVFQSAFSWLMAHQAVVGGLVVAILDFVFAVMPNVESNGLLHWVYTFASKFKSKDGSVPPTLGA